MNKITFTCDICRGEIIFDDGDNPIINTCVCKDNPLEILELIMNVNRGNVYESSNIRGRHGRAACS